MNIVYSSDDNFAEIIGVSILSLLENNKDADTITIYILNANISVDNQNRILKIINKYNRTCFFINMGNIEEKTGVRNL
jgi:lipopolysaccharide biosynthesis glycosyltransferase